MAQVGYTPISLYYSATASAAPSAGNLANGELALNITDGRLFYKDNGGVVQTLATKGSAVVGGSTTQVQYNNAGTLAGSANLTFDGTTLTAAGLAGPHNGTVGATTPNTGAFTTLSASSTVSGAGFSTYLASPPAIGGTAANTGAFTTLAASGAVTLSAGTANGVAYLNGSKVLTTGSALTFDGTNFSSTGGATFQGSPTGYSGGEVRLGATTADIQSSVSTQATGSPILFFDHRGTSNTGLFAWRNGSGGASELMRLTSTGLGIGTSSPGQKLDVVNTGDASARVRTTQAAVGASAQLLLETSNTFNSLSQAFVKAVSTNNGNAEIALTFGTSQGTSAATERARIDSSGNLLVGTTSASARVTIKNATSSDGLRLNQEGGTSIYVNNTNASYYAYFVYNGTNTGRIETSGTTTSYVTSSDYRLKEAIAPMTGALAKVSLLKPCTYKWKVDGSEGQGFIAHELQEVVPQCVTGAKDAVDAEGKPVYQGIDTSFLVGTLTAAIQEQQAIITALTARVTALEASNTPVCVALTPEATEPVVLSVELKQ